MGPRRAISTAKRAVVQRYRTVDAKSTTGARSCVPADGQVRGNAEPGWKEILHATLRNSDLPRLSGDPSIAGI